MKYLLTTLYFYIPAGFAAMQCPVDELAQYTWNEAISGDEVTVDADAADASEKVVTFTGDVIAKRGQEVFYGDEVAYNRENGDLHAPKNMTYGSPQFAIRADKADYSLETERGTFEKLDYYLTKNHVVGAAEKIDVDRKANTEDLKEATYSTCPRLSQSWSIKAKELHLNHTDGIGEAWHTTFRIADVPVFYFPYFSFPLDDRRKTGFLTPSLTLSESRGLDITTPYYINIAPNQDATLYPRIMSKRGFMLGAEYRYMVKDLNGSVAGTYLPDDNKAGKKRWSFRTKHTYQPSSNFKIYANYQRISDKAYIEDFEDTLDLSTATYLKSNLTAVYKLSPNYILTGEFKSYQVADSDKDESDKPYSVLPSLSGKGRWKFDNGLILKSNTELANFDKDDEVSGWRFDQEVSASYLIERTYGFIEPTAIYRFTGYQLHDQDDGVDKTQTRSVPTFALDSGLYFDRQMTWFGHSATQTLEPRLFYLYTPYEDQSDIPDFDTSKISLSYDSMFLTNRFNGKDRIGDANQLTTAVSTSISDNETGKELAKLSVGQIQYFADRKVSLTDSVADTSRSNIVAEGKLRLSDELKFRGLAFYDIDDSHTEKSLLEITYAPDKDKAFSFSHLYDEDEYKQVDFAGVWRINDNWRTFWRWNYSIEYDKTVDVFAGVEYADCCWGVRALARQHRDSVEDNDDLETSFYLEFVLNGLGNVGSTTTKMLENNIPNYSPISYEEKQ